jgi:hypothetical protein
MLRNLKLIFTSIILAAFPLQSVSHSFGLIVLLLLSTCLGLLGTLVSSAFRMLGHLSFSHCADVGAIRQVLLLLGRCERLFLLNFRSRFSEVTHPPVRHSFFLGLLFNIVRFVHLNLLHFVLGLLSLINCVLFVLLFPALVKSARAGLT